MTKQTKKEKLTSLAVRRHKMTRLTKKEKLTNENVATWRGRSAVEHFDFS